MKKDLSVDENKQENENGFRESIGERKAEALIRLKEIISDIGEAMILKGENGVPAVYISVLSDRNRLPEFVEQVRRYRTEDEMYLDREAAAMVAYLDDYLHDLRDFIVRHPNVPSFVTGVFVDRDIQMWSDEAERIVAGDMNAANTKIEEHAGDEWEAVKRRIHDDLHERTALYDLPELPKETAGDKDGDTAGGTDAVWLEWIENFLKQ